MFVVEMKVSDKQPRAGFPETGKRKMREHAVDSLDLFVHVLDQQPSSVRANASVVSRTDQRRHDGQVATHDFNDPVRRPSAATEFGRNCSGGSGAVQHSHDVAEVIPKLAQQVRSHGGLRILGILRGRSPLPQSIRQERGRNIVHPEPMCVVRDDIHERCDFAEPEDGDRSAAAVEHGEVDVRHDPRKPGAATNRDHGPNVVIRERFLNVRRALRVVGAPAVRLVLRCFDDRRVARDAIRLTDQPLHKRDQLVRGPET